MEVEIKTLIQSWQRVGGKEGKEGGSQCGEVVTVNLLVDRGVLSQSVLKLPIPYSHDYFVFLTPVLLRTSLCLSLCSDDPQAYRRVDEGTIMLD